MHHSARLQNDTKLLPESPHNSKEENHHQAGVSKREREWTVGKAGKRNSSAVFTYVSYYYRRPREKNYMNVSWAGTSGEKNLWIFLCSYKTFLSKYPMLLLVDTETPKEDVELIQSFGVNTKGVRILPHLDPRPAGNNVANEHMTKLLIWSLVEYERIVFLDLDAWPVTDISWMFELPLRHGQAAVSNPLRNYPVNTGVMLIAPNLSMYGLLMSTYLRGDYKRKMKGIAGDQALMKDKIVFDFLPQGLNVKWPHRRPQMKPKEVFVIHNLLEEKAKFINYAKQHGWNRLLTYIKLTEQVRKGRCVNLSVFV